MSHTEAHPIPSIIQSRHQFAATIVDLGTLGGATSEANAINNSGQITGQSLVLNGYGHAFLWQRGRMTDLGTLARGPLSAGIAINNKGEIIGNAQVGYFTNPEAAANHIFLYRHHSMSDLTPVPPGGNMCLGKGISDNGLVVGTAEDETSNNSTLLLYQDGKLNNIVFASSRAEYVYGSAVAVNNEGQVTGESGPIRGPRHAFIYDSRKGQVRYISLSGYARSNGSSINESDQVTGDLGHLEGGVDAFFFTGRRIIPLQRLAGTTDSHGLHINNQSQIVGYGYIGETEIHKRAFLYDKGQMTDLNSLVDPKEGWTLEEARGINDRGQIVGMGRHNGLQRAFLLTLNSDHKTGRPNGSP